MFNIGGADRAARMVIGAVIVMQVFVGEKTPYAWIGLVPLVTGLVGFCPLYRLFGFSTTAMKE